MNSNRVYYTPRVEIGSKQYLADVALMKFFYNYEDYLNYMKDELDDELNSENFHDKNRPRASRRSHASRRKITARCHSRSVRNSKILNQKRKSTIWKSDKACYKRARILQPQCVELENIVLNASSDNTDFISSFDSSVEFDTYWIDFSEMFPTYGDYLCSVAKRYVENYSNTICGLEVRGLRILECPTRRYYHSIKANSYEKRVSCLYGKKKKKAQDKQEELKAKKVAESAMIAKREEAAKFACAEGFTTFEGKVLYNNSEQYSSHVHGIYCNPKHRGSSHPIIVPRFAVRETKTQIKMVRSTLIPIFF